MSAAQNEGSISDITKRIYTMRCTQVMIDSDLAQFYGIDNGNLKKAVRRNLERFPADFLFEPTQDEFQLLIFQSGIPKLSASESAETEEKSSENRFGIPDWNIKIARENRGGSRYLPFVFTEQGVAMLSTVLHTDRAIQISIEIMRGFVQLRKRSMQNQIDLVPKLEIMQNDLTEIRTKLSQFVSKPCATETPAKSLQALHKAPLVQDIVARFCGLRAADLKSQTRTQPISLARQIAIFFMKKHLGMSYSDIGRHLGGRDHSTIMQAYRKIHVDSEENETVRRAIMSLLNEIQPLLA